MEKKERENSFVKVIAGEMQINNKILFVIYVPASDLLTKKF